MTEMINLPGRGFRPFGGLYKAVYISSKKRATSLNPKLRLELHAAWRSAFSRIFRFVFSLAAEKEGLRARSLSPTVQSSFFQVLK
jgi:hypothetical protein